MKRILFALVALAAVASAACRIYDVDLRWNANGWTQVQPNNWVSQSFACTADSLLWAEFFVGAANSGGSYVLSILPVGSQTPLYSGNANAGDSVHHQYARAYLTRNPSMPELVKGKEYVLKVTHSGGDSINYYANDEDAYGYGHIEVPGKVVPDVWDLACRIEGVNRAVDREFFGVNGMHCGWDLPTVERRYALMDTAGIGTVREDISWHALESVPGTFKWSIFDPIAIAAATHHMRLLVILTSCPDWASSRVDSVRNDSANSFHLDTFWTRNCAPRNLGPSPVMQESLINPLNYWGYYVYEVVNRYKPGSPFWSSVGIDDESAGVRYYEVWNEPNFWKPPQLGYDSLRAQFGSDTVGLVETLYARLCVVACSAAHKADPGARVIIGGGLSDVFAHPNDGSVNGADWLAGFYRYGGCGGLDYGASVHPYQADSAGLKPDLLARDLDTIQTLRRVNGDEGKELWASELSWGTGDTGATGKMCAALSVPEAYTFALAGTPTTFCAPIVWWCLSVGPARLITYPAVREPCGYAYQQMTGELLGRRMNGRVLSGDTAKDNHTLVYELEDPATRKKTWIGWRNYTDGIGSVAMKLPARTNMLRAVQLQRRQDSVAYEVPASTDGWLTVALAESTVYVRETGDTLRPDLVVDSVWASFVPGSSAWPQKRRLGARVRNDGTAPSSAITQDAQTPAPVKFYANGVQVAQVAHLPVIYHGQPLKVYSDGPWQIDSLGNYLVKAVVNENRSFVELNWDNNAKYRLYQILPIMGSQGGVNGPRTMARASGSSPIQAVAEFTESGNPLIFYCPSLDSATSGWDSLTTGKYPAIGLAGGSPWVTFTRGDTVIGMVYNGSAWRTKVIFTPALGQHVGPAALTVFQSRGQWKGISAALGQVVFPVYQNGSPSSFALHGRFDSLNVTFDTLDKASVANDRDSAVSLCSGITDTLHVAYQRNTTSFYRTARYDTVSAPPSFWSGAKQFGGGTVVAAHPYLEQFKDRVWLVFRRTVNGNTAIMRVSHDVATTYSNWTGGSPVSNDNQVPKDFPVLSTNEAAAWAEMAAGNWHIRARVRDSIADLSDSIANHPHILADTSITDGPSRDRLRLRGLWAVKASADTWFETYSDRNFDRSAAAANATESNNGRKLVLQTDSSGTTSHMVCHTQAGAVYYAEAPAGTDQWTRTNLDGGDLPCLDLDYTNKRLWVAYRNDSSPGIKCQTRSTDSTAWQELTVYDCGNEADSTDPGAPAIIGARSDPKGQGKTAAYCVFALQNNLLDSSFVILVKLTQNGVQDTDTLDRAALGVDSLPAACARTGDFLSVVWQKGSEIYYRVSTDSVRPDTNPPITWSSVYNLSNTQGWSRHATLATSPETTLVIWSEGDTGRITAKGQATGSSYNTWGDAVTLSSDSNPCDYPSIATGDGANDSVVVAWQVQTGTNTRIINARVNFGTTITIVSRNDPVAFPHIAFETAIQDSDTVCYIHCVYSEEPSSNYSEACCDRYDLSGGGGGGGQSAGVFDPAIRPMLFAPAPNPFNGMTCIRYQTNVKGLTRVCIMDITGRRVRNLLTMPQSPGIYNLTWNAKDDRERQLPRGVYFVRLETTNYSEARKLILTE